MRYRDVAALKKHSNAPEHVDILYVSSTSSTFAIVSCQDVEANGISHRKELDPLLNNGVDQSTTLWKEVEDSFVSDVIGGDQKAEAKL